MSLNLVLDAEWNRPENNEEKNRSVENKFRKPNISIVPKVVCIQSEYSLCLYSTPREFSLIILSVTRALGYLKDPSVNLISKQVWESL